MNISQFVSRELPFLTPQTACQHVLLMPKGHYTAEPCKGWFFDPVPIFNQTLRLAYSHVPGYFEVEEEGQEPFDEEQLKDPVLTQKNTARHPNLVSVPYPSSLHWCNVSTGECEDKKKKPPKNSTSKQQTGGIPWRWLFHKMTTNNKNQKEEEEEGPPIRAMPWERLLEPTTNKRPVLMSYVGRFDHGDVAVRQRIQQQCLTYQNPSICDIPQQETLRKSSIQSNQILIKEESLFCLEPAGDSPWRKSLSDSITFGCIPVLFSDLSDDVAPWHWSHWKQQGRILIDRNQYIEGKIDLQTLLESIPPPLLELMQQTIARFARQFQYSLQYDPLDGIHTILQGLQAKSFDLKRQGFCGGGGADEKIEEENVLLLKEQTNKNHDNMTVSLDTISSEKRDGVMTV